jgi:hypothetical protein
LILSFSLQTVENSKLYTISIGTETVSLSTGSGSYKWTSPGAIETCWTDKVEAGAALDARTLRYSFFLCTLNRNLLGGIILDKTIIKPDAAIALIKKLFHAKQ